MPNNRLISPDHLHDIGLRLVWWREALGFTQTELARRLHIPTWQLSRWEAGLRLPNIDALITLCDASSATLDYFFRGIVTASMPAELVEALHREHARGLKFEKPPRAR